MINKEALGEWLASPVTRAYFAGIRTKITGLEEALGAGGFIDSENAHTTMVQMIKIVGRIEGLRDCLEIDHESVIEGDN